MSLILSNPCIGAIGLALEPFTRAPEPAYGLVASGARANGSNPNPKAPSPHAHTSIARRVPPALYFRLGDSIEVFHPSDAKQMAPTSGEAWDQARAASPRGECTTPSSCPAFRL